MRIPPPTVCLRHSPSVRVARALGLVALCAVAALAVGTGAALATAQDQPSSRTSEHAVASADTRLAIPQDPDEVLLPDLLRRYETTFNIEFRYDRNVLGPMRVRDPGPDLGDSNEALWNLATLLRRFQYAYLPIRGLRVPTYEIHPLANVGRGVIHAVGSSVAELPDDVCWGTLAIRLKHSDPLSMQRALLNLTTRNTGVVQPITGSNAILISESRDQLEKFERIIELLDRDSRTTTRIDLEHVTSAAVVAVIGQLFPEEMKSRQLFATSTPDNAAILVRTTPELLPFVQAAVALADQGE